MTTLKPRQIVSFAEGVAVGELQAETPTGAAPPTDMRRFLGLATGLYGADDAVSAYIKTERDSWGAGERVSLD